MKTLKTRILSGAMAGVLAMSLAVPAFAADAEAPKNQTVITGAYTETVIDVVVPGTVDAVINPYGLGTTVTKSDGTKIAVTGQVITPTQTITNNTDLNLIVGAKVIGEVVVKEGADPLTAM